MSNSPPRWTFPLARWSWAFALKSYSSWRKRHQHPFSFGIHLLGIPMTLLALGLLAFVPWPWCVGLFVLGYLFQYIGHKVEGNDMGELIPLKRALGLPVIAIVPRPTLLAYHAAMNCRGRSHDPFAQA